MRKLQSTSLLALLVALAGTPAMAQVHRCVDADGKVSFSDTLCNGARAEKIFGNIASAKGWKEESYRPNAVGPGPMVTPVAVQVARPQVARK
jgi:hypothetical protein